MLRTRGNGSASVAGALAPAIFRRCSLPPWYSSAERFALVSSAGTGKATPSRITASRSPPSVAAAPAACLSSSRSIWLPPSASRTRLPPLLLASWGSSLRIVGAVGRRAAQAIQRLTAMGLLSVHDVHGHESEGADGIPSASMRTDEGAAAPLSSANAASARKDRCEGMRALHVGHSFLTLSAALMHSSQKRWPQPVTTGA
mmetsp:Transcript_1673/g.5280  ORF Transcript_1673/g.5280 Transcript_1673/m.5280 type:complete len:201 (-) Transcript_1673:90-692(-)